MSNVCLFLFGMFIANVVEYSIHRYLFHGFGKKKNSIFAFHLREHHLIARKNNFVDVKFSVKEWFGVPVITLLFFPLYFVSPYIFYGISLYAFLFIVLHDIQHAYPEVAKKYFWWHWNHHMKNQNKSWAVVLPIMDVLTGTLERS